MFNAISVHLHLNDVLLSPEQLTSKAWGPANKATLFCVSQTHCSEKQCHLLFVAGCTTAMESGLSCLAFATGDLKYENEDTVASCS